MYMNITEMHHLSQLIYYDVITIQKKVILYKKILFFIPFLNNINVKRLRKYSSVDFIK